MTVQQPINDDLEAVYSGRIERVRQKLAPGVGLFLAPSADLQHLTGVPRAELLRDPEFDRSPMGAFVGPTGTPVFLAAHSQWLVEAGLELSRYEHRIATSVAEAARLASELARSVGIRTELLVPNDLALHVHAFLADSLPEFVIRPMEDLVSRDRRVKAPHERAAVARAGRVAEHALADAVSRLVPGTTCGDLRSELLHQVVRHGSALPPLIPDLFAAGPRVDIPWGTGRAGLRRRLEAPCAVSVEVAAQVDGFRAVVGRTLHVGDVDATQHEAAAIVMAGQRAAFAAFADGVAVDVVDTAARRIVEDAGFGDGFWVPAGHGVGLELYEAPRLAGGSCESVPLGATLALDIGIWRGGQVSAVAEDVVALTAAGPEFLSGPAEPIVVPV